MMLQYAIFSFHCFNNFSFRKIVMGISGNIIAIPLPFRTAPLVQQ